VTTERADQDESWEGRGGEGKRGICGRSFVDNGALLATGLTEFIEPAHDLKIPGRLLGTGYNIASRPNSIYGAKEWGQEQFETRPGHMRKIHSLANQERRLFVLRCRAAVASNNQRAKVAARGKLKNITEDIFYLNIYIFITALISILIR
jgi:hypothetical protein